MSTVCTKEKVYKSASNGVFGELLQGVGTNNKPFLVTFPVNIFSYASFSFNPEQTEIIIKTKNKKKSQTLSDKIFSYYGLEKIGGGNLKLDTRFSIGKGLASSSADLVATARVLSLAYDLSLTPEKIEKMIRGIEPTDGVMYPETVSYFYREVKINKVLGRLKDLVVIGFDEGGFIDTLEYNQVMGKYKEREKKIYDELLTDLETAVVERNTQAIGNIATWSGYMNQKHNYKKYFNKLCVHKEKYSFLGVVVAHSGTYIGFLIDRRNPSHQYQMGLAKSLILEMGFLPQVFYTND